MTKYLTKAVCIDFDGVIAEFSDSIEEFGQPIVGVREALAYFKLNGYKIIIYTARPSNKNHIEMLIDYLKKEKIPFDEINTNSDCEWESVKPLADLYIDDRALHFDGNWKQTLTEAKKRLGLYNTISSNHFQ